MYVVIHHFALDDTRSVHSVHDLTRVDLVQLHRVLAVAPDLFMSDRLRELRDVLFRFLSDSLE